MFRILFAYVLLLAACNNRSGTPSKQGTTSADSSGFAWSKEDENQFLLDCIDHQKGRYGEDTAFTYCKCILQQVKQKFPNIDSASAILTDSAQVAPYVERCRDLYNR